MALILQCSGILILIKINFVFTIITLILILLCSPKEIDDEEYNSFYQMFSKDSKDPMAKSHFTAEGEVTFRSIIFVPGVSE